MSHGQYQPQRSPGGHSHRHPPQVLTDADPVMKRLNLHQRNISMVSMISNLTLRLDIKRLLTGVTNRGDNVTYSARVGWWIPHAPLLVETISRKCLPTRLACSTGAPPISIAAPFALRGLVRKGDAARSFLLLSSTVSPSTRVAS
jgi:hypothetical protein